MKKTFFSVFSLLLIIALNACGGASSSQTEENTQKPDDAAFYETQPVHSGLYDADYYDITGSQARKGKFDGRIYFALSPATSAFDVFENGNRTKIDYRVILAHPFEKGDSGIYRTVDNKDRVVTLKTDSSYYTINFQYSGQDVSINFNPKPRHEGTAVEILEQMGARKNKK